MIESWTTKLNLGLKVGEIYMDLTKDSLNHKFWIAKTKFYGLDQHASEFLSQIASSAIK